MRLHVTLVVTMAFGALSPASAQEQDQYLLLAAARTGTMQDEINQAAGTGYRVIAASRTDSTEVVVVLQRTGGQYQYRLLATTRTGTLQKEMNEAAEAGYRVVPRAVTTKRGGGGVGRLLANPNRDEGELLILMEKGPEGNNGALYRVLATERTGTLQKEIAAAAGKGFALVALVSRGEHLAIMERTTER
jgi:hypothetical protein